MAGTEGDSNLPMSRVGCEQVLTLARPVPWRDDPKPGTSQPNPGSNRSSGVVLTDYP
jgi:hypothetical protein